MSTHTGTCEKARVYAAIKVTYFLGLCHQTCWFSLRQPLSHCKGWHPKIAHRRYLYYDLFVLENHFLFCFIQNQNLDYLCGQLISFASYRFWFGSCGTLKKRHRQIKTNWNVFVPSTSSGPAINWTCWISLRQPLSHCYKGWGIQKSLTFSGPAIKLVDFLCASLYHTDSLL